MNELPRYPLGILPTPVEELRSLGKALGGPKILIKRDDMTGLALGGNKSRKLEYLVAEALANNARTLVTAGAAQSNHCRQTAAAAARAGLRCVLILTGQSPGRASGNVLLDLLLGAEIVWAGDAPREVALQNKFTSLEAAGERPALLPYGGSSPTGAAAYVFALRELLGQGIDPDWIVLATSSGGTQAGLVAGARLLGFRGKVLGISVDEPAVYVQQTVAALASQICGLLGEPASFAPEDILVNDEFLGDGYGIAGATEVEAIRLFARQEGILLDPVYTGRAAGGLIELVRRGLFDRTGTVLFWHTGGTPAIFADRYQDLFQLSGR
jgi:D-cysteine desulfhydrase family pyridoxal phosphate-dependent enzyme